MKKIILAVAACAAMVACQNGKTTANNNSSDSASMDSAALATDSTAGDSTFFEGITPAADVYGIKYSVALASDSTNGFRLTETYLKDAQTAESTENYNGKYEVIEKNGKKYYQFALGKDDKATFLVANDSTLRMVNDQLEEPKAVQGMNYDLKLQK